MKANWHLILPLVALVHLLLAGFTPLFSGAVARAAGPPPERHGPGCKG